jgi:hypothetical protein
MRIPSRRSVLSRSLAPFSLSKMEDPIVTIERTVRLNLAGFAESIVVEGAGTRIEARDADLGTRFGADDIRRIPTRRSSMFDFIRAAPGISPTSPSSSQHHHTPPTTAVGEIHVLPCSPTWYAKKQNSLRLSPS